MRRSRFQQGSLQLVERKGGRKAWEYRWYEVQPDGSRRRRNLVLGTLEQYPNETAAQKGVAVLRVDIIDVCINNAMIQRKEMDSSDWAMHPRNFSCEFRIPSMEPTMSSINSSTSFGQLLANSRLASDQTPSSGFSCGA